VLSFLRIFGVTVAAVWFGSAIFFTFFVGPAFFSKAMTDVFRPPYNGMVAELVIGRYFILHYICGFLALAHIVAEWIYSGKIVPRATLWLVGSVLVISLIGGLVIQPRLQRLHQVKYAEHYRDGRGNPMASTATERESAAKSFGTLHGVSQGMNLVMLLALWLYLARAINTGEPARFVSPINKFGLDKLR